MKSLKSVISLLVLLCASYLMLSCGESKDELRQQIAEREAIIVRQKREISDLEDQVQELQDKLQQINEYASNAQSAIDNMRDYVDSYDLDDAESELDNIYDESDY